MTCPFKVGDRVHEIRPVFRTEGGHDEIDPTKPDATVTALTARGFKYRYDKPIQFVRADWGTTQEGEVYEEGFRFWRLVSVTN